MPVTNYFTHTKFPLIHIRMIDILEVVENCRLSIEKWHIAVYPIVYH